MPEELSAKPRIAFVQLQKYNRDTGEFEGVMASSAPDQSNEILDWDSSKPHFQRWFNNHHRATKGASLGNVREMHQPIAAGKLTYVRFDDEKQQLYVKGRVSDAQTRVKLEDAVLTGLSIGGDYGKKWADPQRPGFTRYEAKPYEVSLVDNPCNPDAFLSLTNAKGDATLVKFAAAAVEFEADFDDPAQDAAERTQLEKAAATAMRDGKQLSAGDYAHVPDPSKPSTWKYPIDSPARVRNALQRWGQDQGIPDTARRKAWAKILRAADKFGVTVTDRSYKAEGVATMSPDQIVGEELQKQEQFKAQVREALFRKKKGLRAMAKKLKKALVRYYEAFGNNGGLHKSYVSSIAGTLNDLSGQIDSLQDAFTPAVAAGMPSSPGNSQPGENVGGGTGAMVTASPSSSGTGAMVPGVGMRAAAGGKGGKKGLSKKKLARMLEERDAHLQKSLAETIVALLKPPTQAEIDAADQKAAAGAAAGAPMRLVKDAPDANKVSSGAAAVGAVAEPSEAVIAALASKAGDTTDPVGASKAQDELNKISAGAVRKALQGARVLEGPVEAAGFRKQG